MTQTQDVDEQIIDKTPEGSQQQAAIPTGEVFEEYGIMDLRASFPCQDYEWHPEQHEPDAPERVEQHVTVPVRVVKRGFRNKRHARKEAEIMNEDHHRDRYREVRLTDSRGL